MTSRTRVLNELTRRQQEVTRLAEKGVSDNKQALRFLTSIAHYVNYAKNNKLTNKAIKKISSDKEIKRQDKQLCSKADTIIAQMKKDRDTLVEIAQAKGVDINAYKPNIGTHQVTGEQEFSYYLSSLNNYLELPSDQQFIGELPSSILNLVQLTNELTNNYGETKKLADIRKSYLEKRAEFEQELKIHGVYLDYARLQDYRQLELAWKEVYQQGTSDELMMFYFEYGHLLDENHSYSGINAREADKLVDDFSANISRFHNHLVDSIENIPLREEFTKWFIEHLGPTFVSVLIIILLYSLINWLTDGAVTYDDVKELFP